MIIATSPIVHEGNGVAARRIVLRYLGYQYVVHTQRFYEDGSTAFDHGNYYRIDLEDNKPLDRAWDGFAERAKNMITDFGRYVVEPNVDPVRFRTLLERVD